MTSSAEGDLVHLCPPGDEAQMPCCGGWPLERIGERVTADPALVTCPGPGVSRETGAGT